MKWSELINNILRENRISEYGLGDLTGIRQPTLHDLRVGRTKNPQQDTIRRLEEGLGIKIDDTGEEITYEKKIEMSPQVKKSKPKTLKKLQEVGVASDNFTEIGRGINQSEIIKYQADRILELEEENRKLKGGAK